MTSARGQVAGRTLAGGAGFWLANAAISLTPIAAEYRAALTIAYVPMLVQAFVGGLAVALGVSWVLVHHADALPERSPMVRSLVASLVALGVVTLVVEVPAKLLSSSIDPLRYLLIGTGFNAVRILALGLAIGLVGARYDRGLRGHQPGTAAR